MTPDENGAGRRNRSQLRITLPRRTPNVTGMIGAPEMRAIDITPSDARILGPRGPSGVMPTHSPVFRFRSKMRSASAPPLDLPFFAADPLTQSIPNLLTELAIISPSRCALISMWKRFTLGQANGTMMRRPCQKHRMPGVSDAWSVRNGSSPLTSHLPEYQTRRMY